MTRKRLIALVVVVLVLGAGVWLWHRYRIVRELGELTAEGSVRRLHERGDASPPRSAERPPVLILAIDGIDRDLLYELLRSGEMPGLGALLGLRNGEFPHAYFAEQVLTTLPSITYTAWASAFTGTIPAVHGWTGNEFFDRTERVFAAPAGVSIRNAGLVLANFTDSYGEQFLETPTLYQQLRAEDPHVLIWVAMHPVHRGADALILTSRNAIAAAIGPMVEDQMREAFGDEGDNDAMDLYSTFDEEVIEETVQLLDEAPAAPDVLTIYLAGLDLYAHVTAEDPDTSRRRYAIEVLDPVVAKLRHKLAEKGELDNRYIVVVSDHGHTGVVHDHDHALEADHDGEPPEVLDHVGFRVRPFEAEVDDDHDFSAVLAYQGAMAFVHLADRSSCPNDGDVCDWNRPPRYEEDTLAAARAFWQTNRTGQPVAELRGVFDMVLVRDYAAGLETPEQFRVFTGEGGDQHGTMAIADYLAAHPHPSYVALEERLAELAVGPQGHRAGDIILLAHNGDRQDAADRYYFASLYRSWHGSPSEADSRIPFILAHPKRSRGELGQLVEEALGQTPRIHATTPLVLRLRNER